MRKVYAAYYQQGYRPDFVTTSLAEFKKFIAHIAYDMRTYKHLTKQQVELLTITQAIFFESVMEENINAELGN